MKTRTINRRLSFAACLIACSSAFTSGCSGSADVSLRHAGSRIESDPSRVAAAKETSSARERCTVQGTVSGRKPVSPIDELRRLEQLHRDGVLTRDEYRLLRHQVLDCI